mgnify:CR=1 FL=1
MKKILLLIGLIVGFFNLYAQETTTLKENKTGGACEAGGVCSGGTLCGCGHGRGRCCPRRGRRRGRHRRGARRCWSGRRRRAQGRRSIPLWAVLTAMHEMPQALHLHGSQDALPQLQHVRLPQVPPKLLRRL